MKPALRRIAISCASGYVAGLNSVVTGAVLAVRRLGLGVVGIHDAFDGLLIPAGVTVADISKTLEVHHA